MHYLYLQAYIYYSCTTLSGLHLTLELSNTLATFTVCHVMLYKYVVFESGCALLLALMNSTPLSTYHGATTADWARWCEGGRDIA